MNEQASMTDPPTSRETKVLIVEDDPLVRGLLVLGLKAEGFDPMPVENGARAVEVMDAGAPDLVLLDMLMPVMDGLRFLHWMRDEAAFKAPVLVLTCLADRSSAVEALVLGASDVLVKPINLETLVQKISSTVGGRQ